jgi:hypothetical protein
MKKYFAVIALMMQMMIAQPPGNSAATFMGSLSQSTYTIAAYNTPAQLKMRADFVCVDTMRNDSTINRALNYLAALPGAKNLTFLEGTYIDSGSIVKPRGISMFGYGATIKMRSGLNSNMGCAFYADSGDHNFTGVYGFEFDGNESNNRSYTFNNIGGGFYTELRTGTIAFSGGTDGAGLIGLARNMIVKDIYSHDFPRSCFVIAGEGHKVYNITGINSAQDHTLYVTALKNSLIDGVTVEGFVANGDAHIIVTGETSPSQTYGVLIKNINSKNWTTDPVATAYPKYLIKFRSPVHDVIVDGINLNQTVQSSNCYLGAFQALLSGSIERVGINGINFTGFIGTTAMITVDSVKDCYISNSTFTQTLFPVVAGIFRPIFRLSHGTGMLFHNVAVDVSRDPYANTLYFAQWDGSTVFNGLTIRDCSIVKNATGMGYLLFDNATSTLNNISVSGTKVGSYFLRGTASRFVFTNANDTLTTTGTTGLFTFPINGGTAVIGAGDSVRVPIPGLTTNAVLNVGYKKRSFLVADTAATWFVANTDTLVLRGKYNETVSYTIIEK